MVTKIGIAAAVALVAFVAAPSASVAASKSKSANSYRNVHECEGGSCTAVNPDRVPNQSAQFYKKQKTKKPAPAPAAASSNY
jgi:hypothetical protein